METQIEPDNIVVIKRKRGGQPKPDGKTKDPKYFANYYHTHLALSIECPNCKKMISTQKLKRHQLSRRRKN